MKESILGKADLRLTYTKEEYKARLAKLQKKMEKLVGLPQMARSLRHPPSGHSDRSHRKPAGMVVEVSRLSDSICRKKPIT